MPRGRALSRPHFAQGARMGYAAGRGRPDQYRVGEEHMASWSASEALGHDRTARETNHWQWGYQHGYRRAAEGLHLEPEYVDAPEPEAP
jgi:hypothetical protein